MALVTDGLGPWLDPEDTVADRMPKDTPIPKHNRRCPVGAVPTMTAEERDAAHDEYLAAMAERIGY